jgi:hypothetical protein
VNAVPVAKLIRKKLNFNFYQKNRKNAHFNLALSLTGCQVMTICLIQQKIEQHGKDICAAIYYKN